jgi:transposase
LAKTLNLTPSSFFEDHRTRGHQPRTPFDPESENRLLAIVRDDEVCRRLMTIPGVGPVVALTYRATVDVPARFRKSEAVGAVFGLTCSKYQSGETDRSGRISRCGDEMMRVMFYEAVSFRIKSEGCYLLRQTPLIQ